MTALVWFTRDLRVHDHPALRAALDAPTSVVPVFCLDDRLLHGRHASGPRTQFMLECLRDLRRALRTRRARDPARPAGARAARAGRARSAPSEVHFSADVGPVRAPADRARRARPRGRGSSCVAHPGLHAVDDLDGSARRRASRTRCSRPSTARWLGGAAPRRDRARRARCRALPRGARATGGCPSLDVARARAGGGRAAAGRREGRRASASPRFLRDGRPRLRRQPRRARPRPHARGCRPTCTSAASRRARSRSGCRAGEGAEAFRRQLCWRDFYHHVLLHFPRNARSEFQERYRGAIAWSHAERRFDAWREGRTGFPLVDAGMRQLRREGWMHNRARLVVGLVPDQGPRHRLALGRALVHAAADRRRRGQQQRQLAVDRLRRASTRSPFFRRIYNPARHMERYDPEGAYVRRYVPELRDVPGRVPGRAVDDAGRGAGARPAA